MKLNEISPWYGFSIGTWRNFVMNEIILIVHEAVLIECTMLTGFFEMINMIEIVLINFVQGSVKFERVSKIFNFFIDKKRLVTRGMQSMQCQISR